MIVSELDQTVGSTDSLRNLPLADSCEIPNEVLFKRLLAIERKRTERTGKPFVLLLLEAADALDSEQKRIDFDEILPALARSVRETDLTGWYRDHVIPGIILTGLADVPREQIENAILTKVRAVVQSHVTLEQARQIRFSFHFFPDDWDQGNPECPSNSALYCDLLSPGRGRSHLLRVKRAIDVVGSALTLAACSPVLLLTALAVKASSPGPVFFRQERVGQYGRTFRLLKFRSMYVDSDPEVHKAFVTGFIAGKPVSEHSSGNEGCVYKLVRDKRITPLGGLLRRSSLDELPQLLNVLEGDMSMVGPRPPIPYEVSAYRPWHRRRVLEVKPGITGLWQVTARSSVEFDEMVRLDLRYAASWSPWLDLKILLRTPSAVIAGTGAR